MVMYGVNNFLQPTFVTPSTEGLDSLPSVCVVEPRRGLFKAHCRLEQCLDDVSSIGDRSLFDFPIGV